MGVGTGWTVNKVCQQSLNPTRCENSFAFKGINNNCFYGPGGRFFLPGPHDAQGSESPEHSTNAKTLSTTSQFACVGMEPAPSTPAHQRLNVGRHSNKEHFYCWLVGLTDGDGCFSAACQAGTWNLIYKISLHCINLRVLYYIKKQLGVGSVSIDNKNNTGTFRIRDRATFRNVLFPIFDKYPLLTTKHFYYQRVKKIFNILEDTTLTTDQKNQMIRDCSSEAPIGYIAPPWTTVPSGEIMTKGWVVGFIEAEGSFYIVSKETKTQDGAVRFVHGFGVSQKLDPIVLESIRKILHISTKVKYQKKHDFYLLDTTQRRALNNICKYFHNNLKGSKSLEFKLWKKSMGYCRRQKLEKTQTIMRKLRQLPNVPR